MFLACINAFLNGTPGAKHHLGYGMLARAAFGLWGSYFCIMLNVFQSFVFYGYDSATQYNLASSSDREPGRRCTLVARLL
jgi:cytosine/uracil/thiamine/allantoin permease